MKITLYVSEELQKNSQVKVPENGVDLFGGPGTLLYNNGGGTMRLTDDLILLVDNYNGQFRIFLDRLKK